MGVDVRRTRLIIICCATVLTAATVTLCGNIGWVGLILPHLMRLIVGPDYRYLLPSCLLAGGLFMLLVDNTVRLLLPGGIVTSLIGAPLFIYLLFQGRRDWV